jgi:hypothetical protein
MVCAEQTFPWFVRGGTSHGLCGVERPAVCAGQSKILMRFQGELLDTILVDLSLPSM